MSNNGLHNRTGGANGDGGAADAVDVLLDRVTAAVRDMPVPPGPDAQTLADTLLALRAAESPMRISQPPSTSNQAGRKPTMKFIMKLALAACVALAAGVMLLTMPNRNSSAFADVIEQAKLAKSVRYKASMLMKLDGAKEQSVESTTLVVGSRMKQESPTSTVIFDFAKGEMLTLMPQMKTAIRVKMENAPPQMKALNLIDQLQTVKPEQAKDVGLKTFDGKELHGFRVENSGQDMTIWADTKTQRPVRIETTINLSPAPPTSAVMHDFEWDPQLDFAEISMEVPEGYRILSMNVNAALPTETDLIDGLRSLTSLNGNQFPASFDLAGMKDVLTAKAPAARTKEAREAFTAQIMSDAVIVSRAMMFISVASGEDWHYAGAGATLDEADRAVLWYKPKGSDKYHVIDANLSVREVANDELPKIAAKPIVPNKSPLDMLSKPAAK